MASPDLEDRVAGMPGIPERFSRTLHTTTPSLPSDSLLLLDSFADCSIRYRTKTVRQHTFQYLDPTAPSSCISNSQSERGPSENPDHRDPQPDQPPRPKAKVCPHARASSV